MAATGGPPAASPTGLLAVKTYRYLRLAMVGVVLALAISIGFERADVDCWQTSISSYYYTPVRAILVGGLIAIGACLIAIQGSTAWEDFWFNLAGIMAPAVAVLPTFDVGECWSIEPPARPRTDDGLAQWVVANIDNNARALLIAGFVGLIVAAAVAVVDQRDLLAPVRVGGLGQRAGLALTLVLLIVLYVLYLRWDDFLVEAHGLAAVALFVFLALGIASTVLQRRRRPERRRFFLAYGAILAAMVVAAIVIPLIPDWDHSLLFLEAVEIALFGLFWLLQTYEHWHEANLAPS